MKYLKLFENFDSYDPYELMIMFPNKKAEMIVEEIKKSNPNLNLVSDLIALGANVNWQDENHYNWTLLYWATSRGRVEIVRMLIGAGANVNVHTNMGTTPLHEVAYSGNVEIARMIIDAKADLDVQSYTGYTPLHMAARWGEIEIAEMLIAAGADQTILDNGGLRWDQLIDDEE